MVQVSKRSAFSLIELLVVVAIIALLAALLLPALREAKERGKQAGCVSQLHQIGLAVMMYAGDYSGRLPPFVPEANLPAGSEYLYSTQGLADENRAFMLLYPQYVLSYRVFFCPGNPSFNDLAVAFLDWKHTKYSWLGGPNNPAYVTNAPLRVEESNAAAVPLLADLTWRMDYPYGAENCRGTNHRPCDPRGGNRLYLDGHVQWTPLSQMNLTMHFLHY